MAFRALTSELGVGRNAWLFPLDVTFKTIGLRYGWLKGLFDHAPPGPLAMTGRLRAERAAWRAVRRVPAPIGKRGRPADGMPWNAYRMQAMVGGEGITEELRDYLLQRFESVYSGCATDIEIGVAGESPASVALRRLARTRPDPRHALFGDDSRLPMAFQYNPSPPPGRGAPCPGCIRYAFRFSGSSGGATRRSA